MTNVLEFNVNFSVSRSVKKEFFGLVTKKEDFEVLKNVKGRLESGTMTALLGASGCGKSSLLAALSQRLRGNVRSEICFNGEVVDRKKMAKISGFVPQNDVFVEGLTVREHFFFMIELKLPKLQKVEKDLLIESSIKKFGLVGGTIVKYLSGGEQRRLSLASELLTRPQIIFCDEPTSGLDSFSAFSVMNTLRKISGCSDDFSLRKKSAIEPSRIVLFSIHQPTTDIFQLFSNIILMNAGRIIFHGTVHEAQQLFISIGNPCPPRYNPAEFYVNQMSKPSVTEKLEGRASSKEWADLVKLAFTPHEKIDYYEIEPLEEVSWLKQFILLSHRSIVDFIRDPREYLIKLLVYFIISLVYVAVYSGISLDSASAVQDIKGFLNIIALESLFKFLNGVFDLTISQMPLVRKETGNKLYSFSAHFLSMVILMIPRVFFESFFLTAVIYFSTNIGRDFSVYLNIALSVAMSGISAVAHGFFIASLFESVAMGMNMNFVISSFLYQCSGAFTSESQTPFIKYFVFFHYAVENIAISFWLPVEHIECSDNPEVPCLPNGKAVLEELSYGTTQETIYWNYLYQLILTVVVLIFAFFGTRRLIRKTAFY